MGGKYYTYIGPYLRCEDEIVLVSGGKGHGCVNELCGMFHRAYVTPFCAQCGKANEEFEKPKKRRFKVSRWDDFESPIHEALSCHVCPSFESPVAYYTPNQNRPGSPEYIWRDSSEDEGVTELNPESISRDIQWFCEAFAEEIAKAKEVFGDLRVTVSWGRIVYYS
jgi:hypothetical protein